MLRIGTGFDLHRLVPGRRLVLCGVEFSHPTGLLGHSDADAPAHALADAILGAAALGDIGHLFPDTDPKWEGADSMLLLSEVCRVVRSRGWSVCNADVTILAEAPRIGPFVPQMRRRLAEAMQVDVSAVSVKATTMEGLGPVGAREAIAAQASALIESADGAVGGGSAV